MSAVVEDVQRSLMATHQRLRGWRPENSAGGPSRVPSRAEQQEVARQIGRRLVVARELAGYSQAKAAEILGYENSSKLAKIESGDYSLGVPIWTLRRAAILYDVSLDYILGVSGESEIGEHRQHAARDLMALMRDQYERQRHVDIQVMVSLLQRVQECERAVVAITRQSREVREAMERLAELNEAWPDLRGGAKLARAVSLMEQAAGGLAARLVALHKQSEKARGKPTGGTPADYDLILGG